ncbi:thioredoxin family protein [Thiovibrio sp. JS02]
MMKIEFYRTVLCPRCLYVDRVLKKICAEIPDLVIERIEVITNPERARKAGVRSVPTLKIGDDLLAGFMLNRKKIDHFLERCRRSSEGA